MSTQQKIAAQINAQTERAAIEVYTGLHIALRDARAAKADHTAGLTQVVSLAGDALEARLGPDRFDAVMDQVEENILTRESRGFGPANTEERRHDKV